MAAINFMSPLGSGYNCLECGTNFREEKSLHIHLNHSSYCAAANPRTHTCGRCTKTFDQIKMLQEHIRKNIKSNGVGDKPYCEKGFNRSSTLQRHLRTHSANKPYKCGCCKRGLVVITIYGSTFNSDTYRRQAIQV